MWLVGVAFLKKWREFLEGGMKSGFFLQKGKHPIEQAQAEQEKQSRAGPSRAGKAEQSRPKQSREQSGAEQDQAEQSRKSKRNV